MKKSRWIYVFIGSALLSLPACNSAPSSSRGEEPKPGSARAQDASAHPTIDLNCIIKTIRDPAESFHYSYSQRSDSDSVEQELDVTPQTIDGAIKISRGGQTFPDQAVHAARRDADAWQSTGNQLAAATGMPISLQMVNQLAPEIVAEGKEQVGGYDALKYSIDTTRLGPVDQRVVLPSGDTEKGTVWVMASGCPVKITMDTEIQNKDGSVSKRHYEQAMLKK